MTALARKACIEFPQPFGGYLNTPKYGPTLDHTTQNFSFRVKVQTTHPRGHIVKRFVSTDGGRGIYFRVYQGKAQFILWSAGNILQVDGTSWVADGKEHIIWVVCDRQNPDPALRKLHVYVDGVLEGSSDADTDNTRSITVPATTRTTISASGADWDQFSGRMWDLYHYDNKAVSQAEITADMTGTIPVGATNHWPMDDGENTSGYYNGMTDVGGVGPIRDRIGSVHLTPVNTSYSLTPGVRMPGGMHLVSAVGVGADAHHIKTTSDQRTLLAAAIDNWMRLGCNWAQLVGDMTDGEDTRLKDQGSLVEIAATAATFVANALPYPSAKAARWANGSHDKKNSTNAELKTDLAAISGLSEAVGDVGYYSYDVGPIHHVVLDADEPFYAISTTELEWLAGDLADNHDKPVVVWCHYRVDPDVTTTPTVCVVAGVTAGDVSSQLYDVALTGLTSLNINSNKVYWKITKAGSTVTLNIYNNSDGAAGHLMATGSMEADSGTIILTATNDSGMSGSARVVWVADTSVSAGTTITFQEYTAWVPGDAEPYRVALKNAAAVRAVFEAAGNVKLVMDAHQHFNVYSVKNGITYVAIDKLQTTGSHGVLYLYAGAGTNLWFSLRGFGMRDISLRPAGVA